MRIPYEQVRREITSIEIGLIYDARRPTLEVVERVARTRLMNQRRPVDLLANKLARFRREFELAMQQRS